MIEDRLPSAEFLRSILSYYPDTGELRWKRRDPIMFKPGNTGAEKNCSAWNKKWAGKIAGSYASGHGYPMFRINNVPFMAHRVIWKMVHGFDPQEVDHINGNPSDNRLCNLRACDRSENMRNCKIRSDNTSGCAGVFWVPSVSKWRVRVTVNGRNINVGYFDAFEEAKAARDAEKSRHGFSRRHGDESSLCKAA